MSAPKVTVSMPYHGCPTTVRRAVLSVLDQTMSDLVLVVVNDGDHDTPPWPALADITDPRLVRFDLAQNRGRYYADAVTLAVCSSPWWAPHDADDWSEPHRYATLLDTAHAHQAGAVFDAMVWHRPGKPDRVQLPLLDKAVSRTLGHWTHWAALYRADALANAGGLHGGYRVGWDTLVTQLLALTTTVATVGAPLYHYTQRPTSLTQAPATGLASSYRQRVRTEYQVILSAAHRDPTRITELTAMDADLQEQVDADADRLRTALKEHV